MCHFYANPLSILWQPFDDAEFELTYPIRRHLQTEHFEAIRMLPSFRTMIENLLTERQSDRARSLLDNDEALLDEVISAIHSGRETVKNLFQSVQILVAASSSLSCQSLDPMEIYIKAFSGQLSGSDLVNEVLLAVRSISPDTIIDLARGLLFPISNGNPESDLAPWPDLVADFINKVTRIRLETESLKREADIAGTPLRSKYTAQNRNLRTMVVAHKVQLSKTESALSGLDIAFTSLVDELSTLLKDIFRFEEPQKLFLHEVWLYDSKSPSREVFTPKPRHVIERALSSPHDYLSCSCCRPSEEGLSSSQPPTAILYQLYLETGGLINVFDLWSAFYAVVGGEDGEDCDERAALVIFYRALNDLKLLGMVKQSRKKTDHLAKLAWKGL
jgi:origin recognition complex subunit 3